MLRCCAFIDDTVTILIYRYSLYDVAYVQVVLLRLYDSAR